MIIQEQFFKLIPVDDNSIFFDLELLYTINKGKSNERKEFKNVAYGITIETAIKKIANYLINCKHKDEAIKLRDYFKEYKSNIDELTKSLR